MTKRKQIGINLGKGGVARCIKANYGKMGLANFLNHGKDGFGATCVLEYETEDTDNRRRKSRH
jgi:hypothetical protein